MSTRSEKGHAKNVANFAKLVEFIGSYENYNPSKDAIKLQSLEILLEQAQESLETVTTLKVDFSNSTNDRALRFAPLSKLSTRLVNALRSSDADPLKIDDAIGFQRKIQGARPQKATDIKDPEEKEMQTISNAQTSYDQRTEHFSGLIKTMESEPSYAPNEEELSIPSLKKMLAGFRASNKQLNTAISGINKARNKRNKLLYAPKTGLYAITLAVKTYVLSVYTADSPEYRQLTRLEFMVIQ